MKKLGSVLSALALTMIVVSCEEDKRIQLHLLERTPTSFSVSGKWWAVDLTVVELRGNEPPADLWSPKGETIWKISAPKRIWATDWPVITYGEIPDGFLQTVPLRGRPHELAEGPIYAAQIHDSSGAGGAFYFAIRGGKTVNVTDEVLRRVGRRQ
jgi:hypothetical protein